MSTHLSELFGADVSAVAGNDKTAIEHSAGTIVLWNGDDTLAINGDVGRLFASAGNDHVEITGNIGRVSLGRGDDFLFLSGTGDVIHGGRGADTLRIDARLSDFDFVAEMTGAGGRGRLSMIDRLTGKTLDVEGIESFVSTTANSPATPCWTCSAPIIRSPRSWSATAPKGSP
jgi:Ca2+-binding RTX toxin-like protein